MKRKDRRAISSQPSTPQSPQPYTSPNQDSGQEQQRYIRGDVHVRGEIEAYVPEGFIQQYKAARNEQTPRDNARFYVECATLGIVFIYAGLTAIQARQSIKATDIARESLESVQRAFVDPTVSFDSTLNPQKTLASEMIIIHLENSGSTPAKVLKSRSNIAFVTELPNGFNFPDVLGNDSHPIVPSTYIAPKANVTSTPVILDQGQIDLIVSGKMHLYLWGWIRYRDVFSKTEEHITRYSYEIKAVRSKSEGVEYITFGGIAQRYACADEQCKNQ